MPNLTLEQQLEHNKKPLKVQDESIPLEVSTNKLWYEKTPTESYELANKKYVDDNSGGSSYWMPQWSARFQTRYLRFYHPSNAYGANFYLWGHTISTSTSPPTTWTDSKNPCIVVPKNCTLNSYHMRGYASSSQTYELALSTGTPT